jgi:iron(II)-dependent oxidoreductase
MRAIAADLGATQAGVGTAVRTAGRAALTQALQDSRQDTLASFAAISAALQAQGLQVPQRPTLNPPLWELGHIGWFQEWWLVRNPERQRGARADPDAPRPAPLRAGADALYDSSRVPHASRWALPLPDAAATQSDLARQLDTTLELLARTEDHDDALYFFRLALLHEDMHHEAAVYMAQALGLDLPDPRWAPRTAPGERSQLHFTAGDVDAGCSGPGFAFDNELQAQRLALPACSIDDRVVRWREFLPFIDSGGYADPRCWTEAGARWRASAGDAPAVLRRSADGWLRRIGSRWLPVDGDEPACHLSFFEAEAWCNWAGRRLPTEFEWERAAIEQPAHFRWGCVWEWTASAFAPYPGFTPHPYRDYSAPWFDGRPVLRGASWATQARVHHPRYRNYFTPERSDIVAGFRSCAR